MAVASGDKYYTPILSRWPINFVFKLRQPSLPPASSAGSSTRLEQFAVSGEYRVVAPPRRLSYTWTPDWDEGARDSIVDIQLHRDGDTTRVTVTHTAFSTTSARDDLHGWPSVPGT